MPKVHGAGARAVSSRERARQGAKQRQPEAPKTTAQDESGFSAGADVPSQIDKSAPFDGNTPATMADIMELRADMEAALSRKANSSALSQYQKKAKKSAKK